MTTDSPAMDDDYCRATEDIVKGMVVCRPGKWDIRVTAVIHQTVYFEYTQGKKTAPGTVMTREEFFKYFAIDGALQLKGK